jgi:hypothetical protein
MGALYTWRFWKDALERAVKTAAQSVLLGLGLGEGFNAFELDWLLALGFALGGAVLSILTSVASAGVGQTGSPSAI